MVLVASIRVHGVSSVGTAVESGDAEVIVAAVIHGSSTALLGPPTGANGAAVLHGSTTLLATAIMLVVTAVLAAASVGLGVTALVLGASRVVGFVAAEALSTVAVLEVTKLVCWLTMII